VRTEHIVRVDPHPLLAPAAFVARWPLPLAQIAAPPWSMRLLRLAPELTDDDPPVVTDLVARLGGSDELVRDAVRKLLRHGGYKPSGRGKPAAEYLLGVATHGEGPGSINLAVDLCNAVSLHSGLPISVVDLDLAKAPLHLAIAPAGSSYVFNASGQTIELAGLLCLHDADGPCANAVKDAQRTKTRPATTTVLCVIWGARAVTDRVEGAAAVYRELTALAGAQVEPVVLAS
jgi:DNA/RNA-binding domain of Phe-tRNA-synthetase-like protein